MAGKKYYSQAGEDLLLWTAFDPLQSGFFIDVGAFDGIHLSNSYSFEQAGWAGICVEANPDYFPICQRNRPGSICVHAACVGSGNGGKVKFLMEPLGLLSGIRADQTEGMEQRYAWRGMTFPGFKQVEVPTTTLNQLIEEHVPHEATIDLLSIDVEGTELEVLTGLSHPVRIIVVEANTPVLAKALEILLDQRGYRLARTISQNLFFAREFRDLQILQSAKVSGYIEKTQHPLGPQATLEGHGGVWVCVG